MEVGDKAMCVGCGGTITWTVTPRNAGGGWATRQKVTGRPRFTCYVTPVTDLRMPHGPVYLVDLADPDVVRRWLDR